MLVTRTEIEKKNIQRESVCNMDLGANNPIRFVHPVAYLLKKLTSFAGKTKKQKHAFFVWSPIGKPISASTVVGIQNFYERHNLPSITHHQHITAHAHVENFG
jgi:hypothetical protein